MGVTPEVWFPLGPIVIVETKPETGIEVLPGVELVPGIGNAVVELVTGNGSPLEIPLDTVTVTPVPVNTTVVAVRLAEPEPVGSKVSAVLVALGK